MWYSLESFYKSKEWRDLVSTLKAARVNYNHDIICEHCHKPIYKKYDCIGHHIKELTLENVNNADISLNPDNIMLIHHACHNEIHNRFSSYQRHIYLVYGPPLSGKTSYVNSIATKDDLVIDIGRIREAITGGKQYEISNRLNDNIFTIRNSLLEQVKYRTGKWINAFIIGTFPYSGERERISRELEAELLFIDATKEECLERLEKCNDGRDKNEYKKYIEQWFELIGW